MKIKACFLLLYSHVFFANLCLIYSQELPSFVETGSQSVVNIILYDHKNKEILRGKGIILSKEGLILTNYHLISNAHSAEVELYQGKFDWKDFDLGFSHRMDDRTKKKGIKTKTVSIEGVAALDKKLDLAVLKIKEKNLVPAQLKSSNELIMGEKLILIGEGAISRGTITNIQEVLKEKKLIQSTVSASESMSGGAVFNSEGEVIGTITFFDQQTNFIIPIVYASPLTEMKKLVPLSKLPKENYFTTAEGLYLKGVASVIQEQYQEATRHLEQVIKLDPENGEAYTWLGFVYDKLGDSEKALEAYHEACRLTPNNYKAYFESGKIYLKLKRYNEALEPLSQCVSLKPDFPDVFFNLGMAYESLGLLDKSAEAYEQFVKINPGPTWTGLNQLGSIYVKLNRYDKAAPIFQEVIKANPSDIKATYNLAYAYYMTGQYGLAVPLYMKLIDLNPEDAKTYYSLLFQLYDKSEQYEKAMEVCQKIISLSPDNPNHRFNLGIICTKIENYEKALECFNQALSLDPNFDPAFYNIGLVYFKQKKYAEAIKAFSEYTEIMPDNPDAFYNIGTGYLQLKKYEQAIKPLQRAVELRQDYDIAHYNLAIAYYAVGDRFSANVEYETLKTINSALAEKLREIIHKRK